MSYNQQMHTENVAIHITEYYLTDMSTQHVVTRVIRKEKLDHCQDKVWSWETVQIGITGYM